MRYVLDTNAVLYYLHKRNDVHERFSKVIEGSEPLGISIVTHIELFSYPSLDEVSEKMIAQFIDPFILYELTPDVARATIALRKRARMKLPDAVIAATALVSNATLITHNISDFGHIDDLVILDPLVK